MINTVVFLLWVALAVTGCAAVSPEMAATSGQVRLPDLKREPKKGEESAKEALRKLTQAWLAGDRVGLAQADPLGLIPPKGPGGPVALDLTEEAVWIGKETVMIRASWSMGNMEESGSRATRRMANFIFDAGTSTGAMTLKGIEGENPFDPSFGRKS